MKFQIIGDFGNFLGVAMRLQAEGNQCAHWIKDPAGSSVGKNIVDSIHDWKFDPDFETVWVFDSSGMGMFADGLRRAGHAVMGGSLIADRMEMDRAFGKKLMVEAGIQTPKSKCFDSWEAGIAHIKAQKGKRLVIKPSESLSGNLPSHVTDKDYPEEDGISILEHYSRTFAGNPEYELQEHIEGVDISSAAYFDGEKFLAPGYHTKETKKMMNGNQGGTSGCCGNTVWAADDWIFDKGLYRAGKVLEKYGYVGLIDLNVIADYQSKQIWALEWTPRAGYDSEPVIFSVGMKEELGKFFSDFALGQAKEFPIKEGFSAGVRITVPPHPSEGEKAPAGLPILGVSEKDALDWLYFYDIMRTDEGKFVTAGAYGLIGVACAHADSPREAMEQATERAKQVHVSEAQFRTDLADVFEKDLRELGLRTEGQPKDREEPKPKKGAFPFRRGK